MSPNGTSVLQGSSATLYQVYGSRASAALFVVVVVVVVVVFLFIYLFIFFFLGDLGKKSLRPTRFLICVPVLVHL